MITRTKLFIVIIVLLMFTYLYESKYYLHRNDILFVQPMWGIGNRLRVIRKAYELSNILDRRLVIIERQDMFFDYQSMKRLFKITNMDFITEAQFNKIRKGSMTNITNIDQKCETHVDIHNLLQTKSQLYTETCDIYNDDLYTARSFYTNVRSIFNNDAYRKFDIKKYFKKNCSKVVGVHIRQGSIADYTNGNFFGEWDNRDKTMCPYFPQFENESQNLSATHPKAPPIEKYIQKMREYDESVMFFICSDRIGTLLYIHQLFPGRVVMNPLTLPDNKPNSKVALQDFFMLSKCDELVVTQIGSFSTESSFIRNIPMIQI